MHSESKSTIIWLACKVDPRVGEQVEKLRDELPGIGIQNDNKRVYPAGSLAAQIIGFTDFYGKGLEGGEAVLNKVLTGRDGLVRGELDARRRIIPETRHVEKEPLDGKDVYLTIDETIQHIAEQALAETAQKYHPESAYAIVMDPHTGEILALANYPSFDPNKPRSRGRASGETELLPICMSPAAH